jgi:hypothetical protein
MAIVISELPEAKFHTCNETGNDLIITRVFTGNAPVDSSRDGLLDLRETEISGYGYYSNHRLRYGATNGKGGQMDTIELTLVDLNVKMINGYYSTFNASANLATLPLERKTVATGTTDNTYLTWWNYDVVGKDGLTALTEPQKTTIKAIEDGVMDATLKAAGYTFAKTNQARKKGETIYLPADKPGTQSFLFPTNEVLENVYSRKESVMKDFMALEGFLLAPKNHAGTWFDSSRTDDENWLITQVTYKKVFGWYEGTIKYKYANQGWDTDLYSEVSE